MLVWTKTWYLFTANCVGPNLCSFQPSFEMPNLVGSQGKRPCFLELPFIVDCGVNDMPSVAYCVNNIKIKVNTKIICNVRISYLPLDHNPLEPYILTLLAHTCQH
jgi:hypothetical protein